MKPDIHLGENARQTEVSDEQVVPYFLMKLEAARPRAQSRL
jgi:hypothetical protein